MQTNEKTFTENGKPAERAALRDWPVKPHTLPRDAAGQPFLAPFGAPHRGARVLHVDSGAELAWWRAGGKWYVVTAYREGSSFRGIVWILLQKAATKQEAEAVARVALGVPGAVEHFVSLRLERVPKRTARELALAMQAASLIRERYEWR